MAMPTVLGIKLTFVAAANSSVISVVTRVLQ